MLHFSCDLCGQQLSEQRFVVRLEVYPAFDPEEIDEENLDSDHLLEVSEMIEELEVSGEQQADDCAARKFRFDLCPECHRKFTRDPLGRESLRRLNFSQN